VGQDSGAGALRQQGQGDQQMIFGDLPVSSFDYTTIFAVGTLLFAITFAMNAISIRLVRKYREVYE
jgi:ABC-type phosphate transport system permease subunit